MGTELGAAGRRVEPGGEPGRGRIVTLALSLAAVLALSGCGGAPTRDSGTDGDQYADAVPKIEPKSRFGNMHSYVVFGHRYYTKSTSRDHRERGVASWYGAQFHGRKTSSGEVYDMYKMTAAHKTLPLPSYVQVTNLENGRTAVVKVNDRGPFHGDRVIDLSYAAAKKLGVVRKGTATVEIVSVDPRDNGQRAARRLAAEPAKSKRPAETASRTGRERPRRGSPFLDQPASGGAERTVAKATATPPRPEPAVAGRPAPALERSEAAVAPPPREPVRSAPARSAAAVTTAAAAPPSRPAPPAVAAVPSKPEPKVEKVPAPIAEPPDPAPAIAPGPALAAAVPAAPAPATAAAAGKPSPAVYLQVGAFGSRGNAEQLRKRLLAQVSEPVLVREPAAGTAGRLYKVHVGPLDSRRAAALGRQLAARGIASPMVISQ